MGVYKHPRKNILLKDNSSGKEWLTNRSSFICLEQGTPKNITTKDAKIKISQKCKEIDLLFVNENDYLYESEVNNIQLRCNKDNYMEF